MQKVVCDKCNHKFKIKKIKSKKIVGEVTKKYFVCPKCKHEYLVTYEDSKIKENNAKIVEMRKTVTEPNEIIEINKLMAENRAYHDKLVRCFGR